MKLISKTSQDSTGYTSLVVVENHTGQSKVWVDRQWAESHSGFRLLMINLLTGRSETVHYSGTPSQLIVEIEKFLS